MYLIESLTSGLTTQKDYELHNLLSENFVYEKEHISPVFDEVSSFMLKVIVDLWALYQLDLNQLFSAETMMMYTGYNVFSKTKVTDSIHVENVNNENVGHPIYLTLYFDFSADATIGSVSPRPKVVDPLKIKDNIKVSWVNDDVECRINLGFIAYNYLMNDISKAVVHSSIAHELQHIFDMFVLQYSDTTQSTKNSICSDFARDEFELKDVLESYNYLLDLCYLISPVESRARHKEFNTFLNDIKTNKQCLKYVVNGLLRTINGDSVITRRKGNPEFIHKAMVCSIFKVPGVDDIIQLVSYKKHVESILEETVSDAELSLMFLGYYLRKHKMLRYNQNDSYCKANHLLSSDVTKFFSKDNMIAYVENDYQLTNRQKRQYDVMKNIVKHSVQTWNFDYERKMYNEIDKHLDDFFIDIYGQCVPHLKAKNYVKLEYIDIDISKCKVFADIDGIKEFQDAVNEAVVDAVNNYKCALLITVPKSVECSDYEKELETVRDGSEEMFFKLSSYPKHVKVGDRCYVCHNGFIKGWMKITSLGQMKGFECSTTGKQWNDGIYVGRSGKFHYLDNPVECKGFQGYRYIDEI